MNRCIGILLVLTSLPLSGQVDYSWWNEIHNWDGTSHWLEYMTLSPAYMGPNALPVPELMNGLLTLQSSVEMGIDGHYSTGDQTLNLFTELTLPLFTDRAAVKISYVPVEYYHTDTVTRDLRASREYDPQGFCTGDIYFSTFIQIIKEQPSFPDVLLSANIKTASGTGVEGARHTDSPAYWFDMTLGKSFKLENLSIHHLRIYGKAGFYAYQTYDMQHVQNDAFLYGMGIEFDLNKLIIENQITGYSGYSNNGDRPVVYRLIISGKTDGILSYKIRFQQGLHDFLYTSLRVSALLKINTIFNKPINY